MAEDISKREWDVFVSHSSGDVDDARWVREQLEEAGWRCFLATEHLNVRVGSAQWSEKIDEALDKSGAIVVLTSPEGLESEWVKYEWRTVHDDILRGRPGMIVPCCVRGPGPDDLSRALRRYQSVDFRDADKRTRQAPKLLDLIEGYLKKPIGAGREQRPLLRVLSIEGSGVRAVLSGWLLAALEQKLVERKGPQARLADAFDLVAGNSFGGVFACMIARSDPGRFREGLDYLTEHLDRVFKKSLLRAPLGQIFDSRRLEELMSNYFGEARLSELALPCLIPTFDVAGDEPLLLGQQLARADTTLDFSVAKVARASCSSPMYFEPVQLERGASFVQLVDGAVFEPDPTRLAFDETRRHFQPRPLVSDVSMLSIGCGTPTGAERATEPVKANTTWWASRLPSILMRSAAKAMQEAFSDIFERQGVPEQYVRLDAELAPPAEQWRMDDVRSIQHLQDFGATLAERFDDHMDEFLDRS